MSLAHHVASDTCLDIDTMFADLERFQVGQRPFGASSGVGDTCGNSAFCKTVEPVPDSSFSRQVDQTSLLDYLNSDLNPDQHESVLEQLATAPIDPGPCVPVPLGCSAPLAANQSEPLGLQQPMHLDAVCRSAGLASGYQTGAAQCVARLQPCPVLAHQLPRCMPAALPVAASAASPAGRNPLQTVLNGPSHQVASAAAGQQARSLYESSPIVLGQLVSVGSMSSSNTIATGATQSVEAWQTCLVLTGQLPKYMPGALPIAAFAAGSSSLQTVLYGASTASTAAGQQGHSRCESSPPVVLGQLASAGSLCSSSTAFCPEFTGGVRAGASPDSSQAGNTCLGCKIARQQGCTLAAACATNSKMTPSARAMAVGVIARAAACPRQCLITLQLPTESSGYSSSSSPEFFVSFAKARMGEQGCQRACQGTATGRNFNYNCNAPIKIVDKSLSARLGCQDSDKVFTVASSDKRVNMTAIGITRLAVGTSAAAAAAATNSKCNNPLVSGSCTSSSSESLWCSQAVACTKSPNKYQGQSFDLYTWALFLPKSARH